MRVWYNDLEPMDGVIASIGGVDVGYMGGVVAATAAAAKQERHRQALRAEEEDMTDYTQDDLKGDWEFKIVRSETAAFRKPEVLRRMIEEESQAGWVMLEKFDDSRVRFKRPHSARARDPFLPEGVDPYRTRYGSSAPRQALLIGVLIGLVLALGLGVAAMLMAGSADATSKLAGASTLASMIWILVAVLGVVGLLVALFKHRLR
jgi:hypothetical protein